MGVGVHQEKVGDGQSLEDDEKHGPGQGHFDWHDQEGHAHRSGDKIQGCQGQGAVELK